jgi:hypothetical protein
MLLIPISAEGSIYFRATLGIAKSDLCFKVDLLSRNLKRMARSGQPIGTTEPFENFRAAFNLQVSSSGGGLPGRLDLERDSRRSSFLRSFR